MENVHNCHERKELDDRIHTGVVIVARLSKQAAELAKGDLAASMQEFQSIQTSLSREIVRLSTLRECLEIHRTIHGCC